MTGSTRRARLALPAAAALVLLASASAFAQAPAAPTFAKDVAPILQRSCQNCHRPGSIAPMSLISYDEAKKYAGEDLRFDYLTRATDAGIVETIVPAGCG